jgi:hypothetical protein
MLSLSQAVAVCLWMQTSCSGFRDEYGGMWDLSCLAWPRPSWPGIAAFHSQPPHHLRAGGTWFPSQAPGEGAEGLLTDHPEWRRGQTRSVCQWTSEI